MLRTGSRQIVVNTWSDQAREAAKLALASKKVRAHYSADRSMRVWDHEGAIYAEHVATKKVRLIASSSGLGKEGREEMRKVPLREYANHAAELHGDGLFMEGAS